MTIAIAVSIAVVAAYIALEMAGRTLQSDDRTSVALWILAGSLVLGGGAWATQFVVMASVSYPFHANYQPAFLFFAWAAGVLFSALLFGALRQRRMPRFGLVCGIVAAGAMVVPMHLAGIVALGVTPRPVFSPALGIAAIGCSIVGNAIAFLLFFKVRELDGWARVRWQSAAAVVYGTTLSAAHALGVLGTAFDAETVSIRSDGLAAHALGETVAFDSVVFLSLILLITLIERRAVARAHRLDGSLDTVREELRYVTFNDRVTALPNRVVFQDRLQQGTSRCDRTGESLALLYVKLDGFRPMDQLSDPQAEETLRVTGECLVEVSRPADTVANIGAHHFGVIMESLADPQPAVRFAERLASVLCAKHDGGGRRLTASIGITMYPADGPASVAVRNAAAAATDARAQGGDCYRFFESQMNEDAQERTRWLEHLRMAVPGRQLELYYQPKVHAATGAFSGVEALLRWHHPTQGMVGPAIFIPLAEQFGLINELGSWVIGEACRQMKAWRESGLQMRVAINISVHQLRRGGLAAEITAALAAHGVDPGLLTCEITESGAMDDTAATLDVFKGLQAIGVQLSIDDFGTGYSSLSYLRKLPVRQLKIDRSFVTDLQGGDRDALSIVKAIIDLAHALRLEVVAEGVETDEQRRLLLALGCDKLQGFLFSAPVPAAKLSGRASAEAVERNELLQSTFHIV